MTTLNELVERIARDLATVEVPNATDVQTLIHIAMNQADALGLLRAENESLKARLVSAEKKLDGVEPLTHLVQFAEGSI